MSMRIAAAAAITVAVTTTAAGAGTAAASHTHVIELPSGDCVAIAQHGAEDQVDLSGTGVFDHNPNVDSAPTSERNHPLHILVHKGVPGEHLSIEVLGSATDACAGSEPTGSYLNGGG